MQENNQTKPKVDFKIKTILIIFGLFLFLVFLEASLCLGGFILTSIQEHRNLQTIKQKGSYRILCLGESTTTGGIIRYSYPAQLANILNERNFRVKFSVINQGIRGISTTEILRNLEDNLSKYNPQMVITMMGINDYSGYVPYRNMADVKSGFSIKSLKTYKLANLLWAHIQAKTTYLSNDFKNDNPEPSWDKNALSEQNYLTGNNQQKNESINKLMQLNKDPKDVYINAGLDHMNKGDYERAIEYFLKGTELDPQNDTIYTNLGYCYSYLLEKDLSYASFEKATELNHNNYVAYQEMAKFYHFYIKNYLKAEELYKMALALSPNNDYLVSMLGTLYLYQGRYTEAETFIKGAIHFNPSRSSLYSALATVYQAMGRVELAKFYYHQGNQLRLEYYNPVTRNNYIKLKEILDKRGIKLVCVQYPMRNIEPLKKIFDQDKGIVFVDNENVFKKALKKSSYKEYFKDMFGGDFGHCTNKGNKLLAENIANTILKEIFGK